MGKPWASAGRRFWWRLLLPALWPALRLPLYAVAAYGLGVVDLALLLGPDAPAPLAVRLWLWYQDPDLQWRGASASGALLLLALNLLLLAALRLLEWSHGALGKARWLDGRRSLPSPWPEHLTRAGVWVLLAINLLVLASLLLWSLARRWSFPALWPSEWSGHHWLALLPTLGPLLWQSLWLALLCAGLSLLLAVLALEAQQGRHPHHSQWPLWLICLPLLLPQASLLFGLRLQLDWLGGVDGIGPGWVLWSQLLFVFPLRLSLPARPLSPIRRSPHPGGTLPRGQPLARLVAGEGAAAGAAAAVRLRGRSGGEPGPIPAHPAVWRGPRDHHHHRGGGHRQRPQPATGWPLWPAATAVATLHLRPGALAAPPYQPRTEALIMLHTTALTLYLDDHPMLTLPPLTVAPGEVLTLMGPSGCGKSSLLAAFAGVLPLGLSGWRGRYGSASGCSPPLAPQARRIGMLFQDDLLFAHLTVAENLMFGMPAHLGDGGETGLRPRGAGGGGVGRAGGQACRASSPAVREGACQPAAGPAGRTRGPAAGRAFLPAGQAATGGLQNPGVRAAQDARHARPAGYPRRGGCPGTVLTLTTPCLTKEDSDFVDRHLIPLIRRPLQLLAAPCAGPGSAPTR